MEIFWDTCAKLYSKLIGEKSDGKFYWLRNEKLCLRFWGANKSQNFIKLFENSDQSSILKFSLIKCDSDLVMTEQLFVKSTAFHFLQNPKNLSLKSSSIKSCDWNSILSPNDARNKLREWQDAENIVRVIWSVDVSCWIKECAQKSQLAESRRTIR